jgi:hypothetical protein
VKPAKFQIVKFDVGAAKFLGFAKQQCQRLINNGTDDFYRVWKMGGGITIRAKSYCGSVKLWLEISGKSYSFGIPMPNPVPYRGVSVGNGSTVSLGHPGVFYVIASDGEILASEPAVIGGTYYLDAVYTSVSYSGNDVWSGGSNMLRYYGHYLTATVSFDHYLTFSVPEDCIYPEPLPTYPESVGITDPPYLDAWSAGVAAFNARRQAWLKKNSDEFIAALAGNFQPGAAGVTRPELQTGLLPASWDYKIKTGVQRSRKTYQPISMTASYVSTVTSDTSSNLTIAGTKITTRTTTFSYTDAQGIAQQLIITGTLTQVVTQHTLSGSSIAISHQDTYFNWYATANLAKTMQFIQDGTTDGLGQLWNGVEQYGEYGDSTWSTPENPLAYAGYVPSYPMFSNSLVGTAASLYIQYHNTVLPKYHSETPITTHDGRTAWNNSTLYGVKTIELRLFGPVKTDGTDLGAFPDPTDADGCTQIKYYGKATFAFDWATGTVTLKSWKSKALLDTSGNPILDGNGRPTYATTALPTGVSYHNNAGTLEFAGMVDPSGVAQPNIAAYNNTITLSGDFWPDVDAALTTAALNESATLKYLQAGTVDTTAQFADPIIPFINSLT